MKLEKIYEKIKKYLELIEEDDLEKKIKLIPGVIESGLFIGYKIKIVKNFK